MTTLHTTNVAFGTTTPAQPVVVPAQRPSRLNVNAIKGLAITQIVIGILTIILGIASIAGFEYGYWVNASGSGIWFGIWILVTGIIGVQSAKNPSSNGLNGTNMGFNIVCCCVSFLVGIFFLVALIYYASCDRYVDRYGYYPYYYNRAYVETDCWDKKDAGTAIYAILTIAMVTEFIISMIASIYCCLGGCCASTGASGGVILQQQPTTIITTSNTGVMHPQQGYVAYPPPVHGQPGMYPVSTAPQGMYPTQPMQSYPPQAMGYSSPAGMPVTNITYSTGEQDSTKIAPPPAYVQ